MTYTPEQQNARAVDARITALAALAFLKDEDLKNASTVMTTYYQDWGEPDTMLDAANALLGAVLGIARDLATSSDDFRRLTANLVPTDG